MRVAWFVLAAVGCGDWPQLPTLPAPSVWTEIIYANTGEVCVAAGDSQTEVTVVAPDCLSSSCSRDLLGYCGFTVKGSEITVTSTIRWEQDLGDVPCTDDCRIPEASCFGEALPDGTYTVILGDSIQTITVPSTDDCTGYGD